jgi:hypothetical protein
MAFVGGTGRLGKVQKVAYTGTAGTISTAISAGVQTVRIVVTSNAYVAVGVSPTATTSDTYVPANWPEYINVMPGEKVSAIQDSAGGNLIVTEIP